MIFPFTVYLQKTFRITLALEAESFQQRFRAFFLVLLISNYSMQFDFGEHILDRIFRELLHSSLALEAFIHRITHMTGLKNTTNNIANRASTNDLSF